MGDRRVTDVPDISRKTCGEYFDEWFPYYLSIGMTPEEYWEKDCALARAYRKADQYRQKKQDETLWLEGLYTYQALCRAAPIYQAFAKKGTKPLPYLEQPLLSDAVKPRAEKERQSDLKALQLFEIRAVHFNQKFKSMKQEDCHGTADGNVRT